MFAIEFFCGRKYGGWARSELRFANRVQAMDYVASLGHAERRCDATGFMSRVVEVG